MSLDTQDSPASECPFCTIADTFAPYDPRDPPPLTSYALAPDRTSPSTFVVLSTPLLVAFLDILPLSPGHLLLCPRSHRQKLTALTPAEASELGRFLPLLSSALVRATGIEDWNVVQNNGAAAAQVVPHAHFHLIPRPDIRRSGRFSESFTMFGRGTREELDEEQAVDLAAKVRERLADVLIQDSRRRKLDSKL
jgi:diadenosine tetraphosphate (Ap4A) HIT family hydrolase